MFDPQAALEHAHRAADLTKHEDPGILDTLAVAFAAAGEFDRAVETAKAALVLTTGAKKKEVSAQIASRLKLYEQQLPYTEKNGAP